MIKIRNWRTIFLNDIGILILLALVRIFLQVFTNGQYGFFRDELVTLEDARYLAWGYVTYPPVTPFLSRMALELFGSSLNGMRFFSVLVQGIILVLVGLMVRAMGGKRWAQILAALAVATSPASLVNATLCQYVTFDYLWWVLIAYFVIRLLESEDPRWWLGIGVAIGLGALTKYTVVFFVAGVIVGIFFTKSHRYLASPWLWGGITLALLIILPNLVWQIQHNFISITFLNSIHARDVRLGRDAGFLMDQLKFNANPVTFFLVLAGLYFYLFAQTGQRYRTLGWMYLTPLLLFIAAKGRGYYLSPAYPMLIAAGAVWVEQCLGKLPEKLAYRLKVFVRNTLAIGAVCIIALVLPIAPVNSTWWRVTSSLNENLKEEIGWPELVETVARIYAGLPDSEKSMVGILAGDGGEAGAINLYGPTYGLPRAISGFNSFWERGYGEHSPQVLIVIGFPRGYFSSTFETCEVAGYITNRYNIKNEETTDYPVIYIYRRLRISWPEFRKNFQYFG